jgi:hypothetical protein
MAGKPNPGRKVVKGKTVSQSNTEWVAKGTTVNGKKVDKGYLAQKGKPSKKVTATVKVVESSGSVTAGTTAKYKAGRRSEAAAKGAGSMGGKPAAKPARVAAGSATGSTAKPAAKPKTPKVGEVRRGAAGRQDNRWNGSKWVPVAKSSKPTRTNTVSSGYTNGQASKPTGISTTAWDGLTAAQKRNATATATRAARMAGIDLPGEAARRAGVPRLGGQQSPSGTPQSTARNPNAMGSSSSTGGGPKKGDIKRGMQGVFVYDGTKWVPKR